MKVVNMSFFFFVVTRFLFAGIDVVPQYFSFENTSFTSRVVKRADILIFSVVASADINDKKVTLANFIETKKNVQEAVLQSKKYKITFDLINLGINGLNSLQPAAAILAPARVALPPWGGAGPCPPPS